MQQICDIIHVYLSKNVSWSELGVWIKTIRIEWIWTLEEQYDASDHQE